MILGNKKAAENVLSGMGSSGKLGPMEDCGKMVPSVLYDINMAKKKMRNFETHMSYASISIVLQLTMTMSTC